MTFLIVIALLVAATPAFSQPRVYTNADLGRSPSSVSGPPSPAEAAAIMAPNQREITVPVSMLTYGWAQTEPQSYTIPSSPTAGPFGEFAPFSPPRRLDGTLLTDPPAYAPAAYLPWSATPYVPRSPAAVGVGRSPRHEGAASNGGSPASPNRPGRSRR